MKLLTVRTKTHYDSKVKDIDFHVGDWVWVYSPRRYIGQSPKWSRQYGGPFLIEKAINAVNYVVRHSKRAQPIIVHVDKMKKCHGVTPPSWLESHQGNDASVINDCGTDNAEPIHAEYVEPTTAAVPIATDTSTRQQNRPFAGTTTHANMPVPTEEPIDGDLACDSERSVAKPTPLDDSDVTTDAGAVPVRRNPRRHRRKPSRFR